MERDGGDGTDISGIINIRTDGESIPTTNIRIPINIFPISYEADLITVWEPDWLIQGTFKFEAGLITGYPEDDGYASMHINDITMDEASISLSYINEVDVIEHVYDFERDIYKIKHVPPPEGELGYSLTITGNFTGHLRNAAQGFYRDYYTDVVTGEDVPMIVTQFETRGARRAFPCIDEPAAKSTFKLRLGHPSNLGALSNMPIVSSGDAVDGFPGYIWTEFEITPVMSTYLVAFAVSDFTSVTSELQPGRVPHTVWARYDAINDGLGDYVRDNGPEINIWLQQYLWCCLFPSKNGPNSSTPQGWSHGKLGTDYIL